MHWNFKGGKTTLNEENIPAEEKKETKITRFYEKDVYIQRPKDYKSPEKKGTQQIECLRPLTGLNFLREVGYAG
jgi:hypothetical protein